MTRVKHTLESATVTSPPASETPDSMQVVDDVPSVYTEAKVRWLKEECAARGLSVSGTKATLIARLEGFDNVTK